MNQEEKIEQLEEEIRKLKEENQELKDEVEYYRFKNMTYEDLKKNHLI